MKTKARIIHSDLESARFVVLITDDGKIVYSHWRHFQLAGYTAVQPGAGFTIRIGLDIRDNETFKVEEVYGACDAPELDLIYIGESFFQNKRNNLLGNDLINAVQEGNKLKVVSNIIVDDGCEIYGPEIKASVIFINCEIIGDFRWLKSKVNGGVWFLNCRFNNHFSLKSSKLDGNVVFFGCDFSGPGGVSLRGISACSVLMEFGTQGSKDMLWLNEMTLRGCLALNGTFEAPVQLLARQDESPVNNSPSLHNVFIGCQSYKAERLSRNCFEAGMLIEGYRVSGALEIRESRLSSMKLIDVVCDYLIADSCEVEQDVIITGLVVNNEDRGLSIADSVIGRHLRVNGSHLRGYFGLVGTSVGHAWRLEIEHPEKGTPRVDLNRFHADSAWFEPISLIYGSSPLKRFAKPPAFGILAREHLDGSSNVDRRNLAEAYTRFKNWMADTGHLKEEDHAFFYMRHYQEGGWFTRWLLGGVFGWGIRFRNIVFSALLVTLIFSIVYLGFGFHPTDAAMLSLQSFISSFFGLWPETPASSLLAATVTLESMIGVLFVTVIVGAYIRKLLR